MRTTPHRKMRRSALWLSALIALAFGHSMAHAAVYTATFDDLSEGSVGTNFSDGGLTFSDLDLRFPGDSYIAPFVIDATTTATLPSPFSAPNVLDFEGYSSGPGVAFDRFGSAWIDFSGVGASASLDVFGILLPGGYYENTLSLEAWNGSTMVASVSTSFDIDYSNIQYRSLALNNVAPFDRLELYSSGPVDNGVSFICVDNVSVTTVPEPNGISLMTVGLVGVICLRNRKQKARYGKHASQPL